MASSSSRLLLAASSAGFISGCLGFWTSNKFTPENPTKNVNELNNNNNKRKVLFAPELTNNNNNVLKWDSNWDHRRPEKLVKPITTKNPSQEQIDEREEKVSKCVAKVTKNLILVRHGQYVNAETDDDRVLTDLGKKQARMTGIRLKGLLQKLKNDSNKEVRVKLIKSTMTRATETADIILEEIAEDVDEVKVSFQNKN